MRKPMKRGVAALLLVVFVCAGVVFAQEEDLHPQIFISKMRYDYGKVFERDLYDHNFKVMNKGKADLVIDDVKPG